MEARQIDNQRPNKIIPKLKHLGSRLTAHFIKFSKTSTFFLKDERVLLLSHTLQAA